MSLSDHEISQTVLRGFSSIEEVECGMARIGDRLEQEKIWYGDAYRYPDYYEILGGALVGELVKVKTDANIKPIARFRNPELETIYPPFLTPGALACMQLVGREWRRQADKLRIPQNFRLSATSFVRSQEYQDELVGAGKFAITDSVHVTGNAFDIDNAGYSADWDNGAIEVIVSLREPEAQETIASAFVRDYGVRGFNPIRIGPKYFHQGVPEALTLALDSLQADGRLAYLNEMPGTLNNVMHIAAAPDLAA